MFCCFFWVFCFVFFMITVSFLLNYQRSSQDLPQKGQRQALQKQVKTKSRYPNDNYMFKISNRRTRTRCEICSKLTVKILERRQQRRSSIFIVNFERIYYLLLVFLLLTLNMKLAAWQLLLQSSLFQMLAEFLTMLLFFICRNTVQCHRAVLISIP